MRSVLGEGSCGERALLRTVLKEAEAAGAHGIPEEDVVHESAASIAHCAGAARCQRWMVGRRELMQQAKDAKSPCN